MRKLIYSATVSLDGFIAAADGDIGWSAPSEELFRFHTERVRTLAGHLCGRRLYEVMRYWDTAGEDPALPEYMREFAAIWKALPKTVVSTTLESVSGNARLVRDGVAAEVARLKDEPGADLEVGGAGLASSLIALGLVDEFRLFASPVVLGGGTPYFPASSDRIELELLETRTFSDRVVYLRYGVSGAT